MKASLMEAKKKALAELIKKMRMLEAKSDEKEGVAEEVVAGEEPEEEMEEEMQKPGKMVMSDEPVDDEKAARQEFMKNGGMKKPMGGKTKAVIMSVSMKKLPKAGKK